MLWVSNLLPSELRPQVPALKRKKKDDLEAGLRRSTSAGRGQVLIACCSVSWGLCKPTQHYRKTSPVMECFKSWIQCLIPALGKLKQEDCWKSETSLGYKWDCLKKQPHTPPPPKCKTKTRKKKNNTMSWCQWLLDHSSFLYSDCINKLIP